MPRRAQGPIPMIPLDPGRRMPLHRQITVGIRDAILQGQLPAGSRLPSTRSLADDLGVSRSTVIVAVDPLKTEGYLRARPGSGTFVPFDLQVPRPTMEPSDPEDPGAASEPPLPVPPRPFLPGVPATDELARSAFGRMLRRVWRDGGPGLLAEGPAPGDPRLRAALARYLGRSRGVRCGPADIIITSGAQEGLSVALSTMVEAGEEVWIEDPGYLGARRAIQESGALPVPIPLDGGGIRVAEGIRRAPGARAAYVTPSHQFPTGIPLSLRRRLELLKWASSGERWILEDDYDSEFRLAGRPLPSLQGLDDFGRVVYVGTFSKSLAPALRIGFLVMPPALRDRAIEVKRARTGPASLWIQHVTARFLEEGHFSRHIRRTRSLYRERRDILGSAVTLHLPSSVRLRRPTGAMHAILTLPPGADDERITEACGSAGVDVFPLSRLSLAEDGVEPALVLGFAGYAEGEIREAAGVLGCVLDELLAV